MNHQSPSNDPANNWPRFLWPALFGLLLFSILLRLALTLNKQVDIDEFQHLHAAWMVSQHYQLYRDFWENHTPLFYYFLIPLFRFCREGSGLVIAARLIMSFSAFAILLMTYALARTHHDRGTSFLAVLILSYMAIFMQKSIEVRPDQILVALWLASLWMSIRALAVDQKSKLFFAGFLLGVAFLFSPKALLPLAAMSFTFAALSGLRRPRAAFLRFVRLQGSYALGFMVPVVACLAWFYQAGTFREMLRLTVLENLRYPDHYRPFYLLHLTNICFFLLAGVGVAIHLRSLRKSFISARESRLAMLLPTLFLLTIFIFVEAAAYPQSVLLFAPLLAVYGAEALRISIDSLIAKRRSPPGAKTQSWSAYAPQFLFLTFTLAAGLFIPGIMLLIKNTPFTSTNAAQFRRMEYVLKLTRPTEVVFDGQSAYVFRPQAFFYSTLFRAILRRIEEGDIREQIPQSLINSNCRVIIYDERVLRLPPAVQSFLRANYEASAESEVYGAKGPLAQRLETQIEGLTGPRLAP